MPAVVARMWGQEPRTSHGPRPSLSLQRITEAAIGIADADGLAGVRMSSVAARLDVSPMALYGYVGSKEELLTAMTDAAAPPPPEPGELHWRDYLTAWTRSYREFLLTRPWLLEVSPLTPPTGPRALSWLDRLLVALSRAGLTPGEGVNIATTLSAYAVSTASLAHSLRGGADETGMAGPGDYGVILTRLADPAHYPGLSAALGAGAFGGAQEWVEDADFGFGLGLLLDGIEALITRRAKEER
ncbi:TetR/AcrR family transcriptional regulator [Nonomuraea sp. NPDC050404]|uniref:TetR/AcrR family transcriptional regulator n=1 Tax=Nonomuraea sp. NPDC050404 TaxID=3155783 RepID=UPI0033D1634C